MRVCHALTTVAGLTAHNTVGCRHIAPGRWIPVRYTYIPAVLFRGKPKPQAIHIFSSTSCIRSYQAFSGPCRYKPCHESTNLSVTRTAPPDRPRYTIALESHIHNHIHCDGSSAQHQPPLHRKLGSLYVCYALYKRFASTTSRPPCPASPPRCTRRTVPCSLSRTHRPLHTL